MDFNKNQTLNFTSKLSGFETVNQEFTRCKCYMLATGDNANGSDITLESVKKAMSRGEFDNKPVIAHLYKDEENGLWRVGGHDSRWVITSTSVEIINECIPFGIIPESSGLQLEEVLEPDGITVNTYLTCSILLWTGRFNIMDAAYNDDIYFNQSCEITVNEYHWKENDVIAIDDFTFSALCLLNKSDDASKNVRPCFPSCRVEKIKDFSVNTKQFQQNFERMLKKLGQYEASGAAVPVQNKPSAKQMEGEKGMDFTKIVKALSAQTYKNDNGQETCKYRLLNTTDRKVLVLDMEDYKPYGFNYAVSHNDGNTDEAVIIDFESKIAMSLSATDKIVSEGFEEFSIKNEIDTIKETYYKRNVETKIQEVSAQFQKNYDRLEKAYTDLEKSYNIMQGKLDIYEQKEKAAEMQQHKDEIDALVDSYADKLGRYPAYLVYKANIDQKYELSKEQVAQELMIMAGKFFTGTGKTLKKFAYVPPESGVAGTGNDQVHKRYGHFLDKYL